MLLQSNLQIVLSEQLMHFDASKTSWTKLRHMVNKLFWRHMLILLDVWKCLILRQIIIICGNCWFSSFIRKKTAAEAQRELQKVYGDAVLCETTCRDWFRRFKDGDFDVNDRPPEGRPKTFEDEDVIYYELSKPNKTITGEQYRTQMTRLSTRGGALTRPAYPTKPTPSPSPVPNWPTVGKGRFPGLGASRGAAPLAQHAPGRRC